VVNERETDFQEFKEFTGSGRAGDLIRKPAS